jgi:hypothetical protein
VKRPVRMGYSGTVCRKCFITDEGIQALVGVCSCSIAENREKGTGL